MILKIIKKNTSFKYSKLTRMIRRKLTQLEVTLDDTKELDDLLIVCKPSAAGLASSSTATISAQASSVPSFLTKNNFYPKHLHYIGKPIESSQNADSIIIESAAGGTTSTTTNVESITTESSSSVGATSAEVGFNPQPYNPTNRFQFNQESQQLR